MEFDGEGYQGMHYETRGEGDQTVLLVHGLPSSLQEWGRMSQKLVLHGYRSMAVDLPGHGESFQPAQLSDYSADAYYAVFEAWLQNRARTPAPVLLGHSFGGYLCLRYALDHPQDVRALILINPFLAYAQMAGLNRLLLSRPGMAAFVLKHTSRRLMLPLLWAGSLVRRGWGFRSYLAQSELRQSAQDFKRCSPQIGRLPRTVGDLTPRLPALAPPTLLIWGKRDPTLSPAWYAQAASLLPNAKCQALNAGHNPQLANFEEVWAQVINFLETIFC